MTELTYPTRLVIRLAIALDDGNEEACESYLEDLEHIDPDLRKRAINLNVPGEAETLLHAAAREAHFDVARHLIDWGADVHAPNEQGDPPIVDALRANRWKDAEAVILALINAGTDVTRHDHLGMTALHHAAAHGSPGMLEALLAAGADPNATDNNGWEVCPLHSAASDGNAEAISVLIKAGAEPGLIAADGESDLMRAVMYGHQGAARALIDVGCNVNHEDGRRRTPLHFAARNGDNDIVAELVDAGADLDAKDDLGQTPAQILAAFGETALLEEFKSGDGVVDEQNSRAVFMAIVLQNSTGAADYVESSFIAMLHGEEVWLERRFRRFEAALKGLAEGTRSDGMVPRMLANICQFQSSFVAAALAAHFNPDDTYTVRNLDADTLYDLGEDARVAFAKFFSGESYVNSKLTVAGLLELDAQARYANEED